MCLVFIRRARFLPAVMSRAVESAVRRRFKSPVYKRIYFSISPGWMRKVLSSKRRRLAFHLVNFATPKAVGY